MKFLSRTKKPGLTRSAMTLLAVAGVALALAQARAKTPDGSPPSVETVCSGLSGAAFGLCNAYCEAQDCDTNPGRPSCEVLRSNFEQITGSSVFPCDPQCGDGVVNQRSEQCDDGNNEACDGCSPDCTLESCGDGVVCSPETCEPGDVCDPDGTTCNDDCTCGPRCPVFDRIIDADGTATPTEGIPAGVQVRCGDPLILIITTPNVAGLDVFDNDGNGLWTFGPAGDDIHLEDPSAGTCPTARRNGIYDNNAVFQDCVVLDLDGSLVDGQLVTCDNACYDQVTFLDSNGNGFYDDGEDLVLDSNANRIFD